MTTDSTTGRWAELWLRMNPDGVYEPQRKAREQVDELVSAGVLEAAAVSDCCTCTPLDVDRGQSDTLAAFEAFEAWADRTDVDLAPAFDRRTRSPLLSEATHEVVVFPVVCLALYDANDLRAVFPCVDGDDVYTVQDCLDALSDGTTEDLLAAIDGAPVRTPTAIEPA